MQQKLSYMYDNPWAKKWNLCNSPEEYGHSSPRFYITGEAGIYPVTNFMKMENVIFIKQNNFS